jgi:hypothetical protein
MSTSRLPFPDDHDTITPMTEEERSWRLARMKAAIQEALDDPRPSIPHEEVVKYFAKKAARRDDDRAIG